MEKYELFNKIKEFEDLVFQIDNLDLTKINDGNELFYKIIEHYRLINEIVTNAYSSFLITGEEYVKLTDRLLKLYKKYCFIKIETFSNHLPIPTVHYIPYIVNEKIDISSFNGKRIVVTFPKAIFEVSRYCKNQSKSPIIIDRENRIDTLILPNVTKIDSYSFSSYPSLKKVEAPNLSVLYGESFPNIKSKNNFVYCECLVRRVLRDILIKEAENKGLEVDYLDIERRMAIIDIKSQIIRHETFLKTINGKPKQYRIRRNLYEKD